jgi:hypothetical protein
VFKPLCMPCAIEFSSYEEWALHVAQLHTMALWSTVCCAPVGTTFKRSPEEEKEATRVPVLVNPEPA